MTQPTDGTNDPRLAPAAPGVRMAQAVARLERSRANLRQALAPTLAAPGASSTWSLKLVEHARAWLRGTPWGAVVEPLVDLAGDTLSDWWVHQTWRKPALQARDALMAKLSPWVRRHPMAAVTAAALAGATLAASGVWRWRAMRRPALQLAVHLRRAVAGQLSCPAVQSMLMGAVLSMLAARKQPPRTEDLRSAPGAADTTANAKL